MEAAPTPTPATKLQCLVSLLRDENVLGVGEHIPTKVHGTDVSKTARLDDTSHDSNISSVNQSRAAAEAIRNPGCEKAAQETTSLKRGRDVGREIGETDGLGVTKFVLSREQSGFSCCDE
jgi:hypothetical protein